MRGIDPVLRTLRRVVVATSRGPLRPVWRLLYGLATRLAGRWLAGAGGAGVYVHERREMVAGLSDIDLSVIAEDEPAMRVARERRARMLQALAPLGRPVECFHVETRAAVAAACRGSVLTHGLHEDAGGAAIPMQNRPVPSGQMTRVAPGGRHRAPPARARVARSGASGIAWLDVQFWWRHAFHLCTEPPAPWTAFSCVKLVADPLRTLRWLEGGGWQGDRREILEDALGRRPGQEEAIAHALWLLDRLHRDPAPRIELALGALVRSSHAIGDEIAARARTAGHVEVGLTGEWDRSSPPLLDWWARAKDVGPWRRLAPMDGEPALPEAVRAAAMAFGPEISPVLRDGSLVVTPSPSRARRCGARCVPPSTRSRSPCSTGARSRASRSSRASRPSTVRGARSRNGAARPLGRARPRRGVPGERPSRAAGAVPHPRRRPGGRLSAGPELCTVVMSYRNHDTVLEAVDSLRSQSEPPEIVVSHSGGGVTPELLAEHGVKCVASDDRRLPGWARNAGIEATEAPFVSFLAADCLATPGWAAARMARHRAGAKAIANSLAPAEDDLCSRAAWIFEHSSRLPLVDPIPDGLHGVSYARELLEAHGPFREDVLVGEDTQMNQGILATRRGDRVGPRDRDAAPVPDHRRAGDARRLGARPPARTLVRRRSRAVGT